jgi:hypothetical protein
MKKRKFCIAIGMLAAFAMWTIAAIPSETPDRDMSALHSLYAYGVLTVVIITTIFLKLFGRENWMFLTIFWAMLPLISFVLYCTSPMPDMNTSPNQAAKSDRRTAIGLALCTACIFLGSAAENTMTNWISGFMENALFIPKAVGDILGLAVFAILLALVRTLYAKYGKNISLVLLIGMIGAVVCYLIAGLSPSPIIAMIACVLTGMFTSMLWPGTLILMEEHYPGVGITAYALMAAGGDFGASVGPQLIGIITDAVAQSPSMTSIAQTLSLSADQLGMKLGMLVGALFPLAAIFVYLYIHKTHSKNKQTS